MLILQKEQYSGTRLFVNPYPIFEYYRLDIREFLRIHHQLNPVGKELPVPET